MIFYTLYITPLALQVLSSETLSELGQEQALATRLRVVRELQGQVDITVCSVHKCTVLTCILAIICTYYDNQ